MLQRSLHLTNKTRETRKPARLGATQVPRVAVCCATGTDRSVPLAMPAAKTSHRRRFAAATDCRLPRKRKEILLDAEAALSRCLDHQDYDLAGEVLLAWPLTGRSWGAIGAFGFRVLAHVEDQAGFLPSSSTRIDRLNRLHGEDRAKYLLATAYHTGVALCSSTAARPIATDIGSTCGFDGRLKPVDSRQARYGRAASALAGRVRSTLKNRAEWPSRDALHDRIAPKRTPTRFRSTL